MKHLKILNKRYNKHMREAVSVEEYVSNPINSLNLIKRTSSEIDKYNLTQIWNKNATAVHIEKLQNFHKSFPTFEDWVGACNGVHLLQEHYQLNITEMSQGIIKFNGEIFKSEHAIHPDELAIIGIAAANQGFYDASIDWLTLAKERYNREKHGGEVFSKDIKEIKKRLKDGKAIHDHYLDRKGVISNEHRCKRLPFDEKLRKKKKYKTARHSNSTEVVKKLRKLVPLYDNSDYTTLDMRDNFEVLCKGESMRTSDMDSDKQCRRLHHKNPYLRLGPFKLEEHSFEPYITVIHQLMYEDEMQHFKNYASDRLERSGHGNGAASTTSLKRTSKQTWLDHRYFEPKIDLIHKTIKGKIF